MLQNDYIMRAIQQLVAALARIISAREAADFRGAGIALQAASKELTGLGIDAVLRMGIEGIVELFRPEGVLEAERAAMMARLLKEYGVLLDARGYPEQAKSCYVKSFCLYDELEKELGDDLEGALDPPGLEELGNHTETFSWLVGKLE